MTLAPARAAIEFYGPDRPKFLGEQRARCRACMHLSSPSASPSAHQLGPQGMQRSGCCSVQQWAWRQAAAGRGSSGRAHLICARAGLRAAQRGIRGPSPSTAARAEPPHHAHAPPHLRAQAPSPRMTRPSTWRASSRATTDGTPPACPPTR